MTSANWDGSRYQGHIWGLADRTGSMGTYDFLDPHLEGKQKNLISKATRDFSGGLLSLEIASRRLPIYV